MYLGLPTVIGWARHQKQRWGSPNAVGNRRRDVTNIRYTGTESPDEAPEDVQHALHLPGPGGAMYYKGQGLATFDAMLGMGLKLLYENPRVKIRG